MSLQDKAFLALCRDARLPEPVPEYRITDTRKFRWDWAWPDYKLLLEINGSIWKPGKGGHSSGKGIRRDMDKLNLATSLGWRTLAFEPKELFRSSTIDLIRASILAGAVECRFLND